MTEDDDQIGVGPKFGKLGARCFDDVDRYQASANMSLIPLGDLRRRDADHAHLEPLRRSGLVDECALDHDRRRKKGRAVAFADIACDHRKARLPISALKRLKAVVEIVVAESRGVVIEPVHSGDHGMDRALVRDDRSSREIAERGSLKNVAVVEQERVRRLAARLGDQGRGAREADGIVGAIAIIVVRIEIGVQVGEAEQPQAQARPMRAGGGSRSSLRQGVSFVTGSRSGDEWIIARASVPVKAAL